MAAYENTFIASSYSKELSLSGERIGYAAANPAIPEIGAMMDGLITGQPRPGLRQRAGPHAAGGRPSAGSGGGYHPVSAQPRRALGGD